MAYVEVDENTLYIAEDGNYGGGKVILTTWNEFTDEQIDVLDTLSDNDKYEYALAVLNGEDTSEWEE